MEKNLDDIIFEKRNKVYGAYLLRKIYSRNLIKAMLISFTVFLMIVSIPLIASYLNVVTYVNENKEIIIDMSKIKDKEEIKIKELPKLKADKVPVFKPPVVVINPDEVITELGDIIEITKNSSIGDTLNNTIEIPDDTKKDRVIDDDDEIKNIAGISEMPEYPGGDVARIKFFSENIKYPLTAKGIGIQGPVYFTFVVERDGSITQVKLLRGIGAGCDEEAARVISMMPKWNPGRQNGKPVRVQFIMPISFVLR